MEKNDMSTFLKYNNHMILHPTDSSKYFYVIAVDPYNPLGLPPFTIRCKFTSGYTPNMGNTNTLIDADENIWDIAFNSGYNYTSWSALFAYNTNLLEVIGANTTGVVSMPSLFEGCESLTSVPLFDTRSCTRMDDMFDGCILLTSVPLFDTSSCTDMRYMMARCTSLTSVPLFDTSSCTRMNNMFLQCRSLTSVPLFNTSSCTRMEEMLFGCTSLTSVPLFDTSSCTNMNHMFYGCTSVESGALALYQQASTQATPPSSHSYTFGNCGSNTVTGAAELAQIPASWGGTGA